MGCATTRTVREGSPAAQSALERTGSPCTPSAGEPLRLVVQRLGKEQRQIGGVLGRKRRGPGGRRFRRLQVQALPGWGRLRLFLPGPVPAPDYAGRGPFVRLHLPHLLALNGDS